MRRLAVLIALLAAAPAQARLSAVTEQSKRIAEVIAHNPCAEQGVHIRRDYIRWPNGELDYATLMTVPNIRDRETGKRTICRVIINKLYWLSPAALCTGLAHEYLHLADWTAPPGKEYVPLISDGSGGAKNGPPDPNHHRDPWKLMYPSLKAHGPNRRCVQAFGRRYVWRRR